MQKPFYFLHIPRSCGTSIVANLKPLIDKCSFDTLNGNPVIRETGEWIPFWEWTTERQLLFCNNSPIICNERMLGSSFSRNHFKYFTCIRDPLRTRISILNKFIRERNYHENGSLSVDAVHKAAIDLRDYFPSNLITWMTSAPKQSTTVTQKDISTAIERLSYFKIFRPSRLKEDFEEYFGYSFDPNLSRHNENYIIDPEAHRLEDMLAKDIDIDIRLMNELG